MNNLMRIDNHHVAIWDDQDQIRNIKEIYGKTLSSGEFKTFIEIGRATSLNPFLREIWAVKYGNNPASIFIGRDGYRRSAQANRDYDYHEVDAVYSNDKFERRNGEIIHEYSMVDRGKLVGAYCQVKRKSSSRPIFVFVDLSEYSTGKSLWQSKPATMIKKVAEAQGLRMAFQELFAGTYDESEAWQNEPRIQSKARGIAQVKERIGIKVDKPINDETGEIIEGDVVDDDPDLDYVKSKIENASSIQELVEAADIARTLPEEDRSSIRVLYKEKEKSLA